MNAVETKTKNILIVEDDRDMQDLYRMFFAEEAERYDIDIENAAMQASKRLEAQHYDIIILDIIMQPISGDSFFMYLRENMQTRNIPVIIASVLKEDSLRDIISKEDVYFLQKPITKEQLLKKIEQIIS